MRILSIGNSFSQDASRYFHRLAKANGYDITSVNFDIGGCSLERHYKSITEDLHDYALECNGESTGVSVSANDGLFDEWWDYITVQQASKCSPNYETYQPYLNDLVKIIREKCPSSKIVFHRTWAYEEGSDLLCKELGYKRAEDMFRDIKEASEKALAETEVDGVIPSGDVFMEALNSGIKKMHRDTLHADLGIGRYALALTWLTFFTGCDPMKIKFSDFDVPVSKKEIRIVKKIVKKICPTVAGK